ncbi:flap endonuclease GEN homolog 1 [Genypterus blacodes]|uniref:flap endonuclease GEN homolog 1 n=1 Tax=Genypterus blacodes TaxID=154954 RepID=UPI003F775121
MGVQDLWSIVQPVCESVPLYSLSGKTLAVDLSLWVCEAQHVQAMMGRVTKPHLRNLFFRVSSLTLMGVKLVFVMEGEAPKLKAETMQKRNQNRQGGSRPTAAAPKPKSTSRGRFNAVLRECAEMLDYLGVPWVTAAGEAEAMCAYLDSQGLVDGCITNDGDAFLYGARTVYRNFNMNTKDPQVDCYRTSRVHTELHLSRENLVGLAILLGCDYIPKGIPGVGKEQTLRLILALQGQTLLQRFMQWKKENPGVSEGVRKKVPHCQICRHPGSSKAHERSGCVLCDSNRFCQPQDFDYQCPCDWHRSEQTRQASSFEANVRKKTLASNQFPFTEIINEFLISKDKPVAHFRRRQPNILQIQKFAYDKMEWPKFYTSEKVLVLVTYTELMNKGHGREMSSQIKPLRILKPRVRNGVACFEVIWSKPEHYTFPEDHPAENQHEVRTVEEESLFRVAFPEVVERHLRDKALAEESKIKKKKPRSKKEKPSEACDGISDLLAQMTLQSSSLANSNTQPQSLIPVISNNEKPVVVLDTPVSHKRHSNPKEHHSELVDSPKSEGNEALPLSQAESQVTASPSDSVIIQALHLSDINWDSSSFTSSPPPPAATNHITEFDQRKTTDDAGTRNEIRKQRSSSDSEVAKFKTVPELRYTECPLRDRVLMKNTAKSMNQMKSNDVVTKQLNYEVASPQPTSTSNSKPKPHGQISIKGSNGSQQSRREHCVRRAALTDKGLHVISKVEPENYSTDIVTSSVQSKAKEKGHGIQKHPHKYKFVKAALSSSIVPHKRCHSDPNHGDKDRKPLQTSKTSVCSRVCSSSDDSDTENQQSGLGRKAKNKPTSKIKGSYRSDVSGPKPKATLSSGQGLKLSGPKPRSHSVSDGLSSIPVAMVAKSRDAPAAAGSDGAAFPQIPASPIPISDSDDSVICSESPLPLAERLRLKLLK